MFMEQTSVFSIVSTFNTLRQRNPKGMSKFRCWYPLVGILLFCGCSDDEENVIAPVINLHTPGKAIATHTFFYAYAEMTSLGNEKIASHGFVYSTQTQPDVDHATKIERDGDLKTGATFSEDLDVDLLPNTTYYIRAFVKTAQERIYYSNTAQWVTLSGTWKQLADFPGPHRLSALTFNSGNNAYIVGGVTLENQPRTDVWQYDAAADTWSQKADFPAAVDSRKGAAFVVNDSAYVVTSDGLWRYDALADAWQKKGDGLNQVNMIAFGIGEKGYVGSGSFNGYFYAYDRSAKTWTTRHGYPGEARLHYYSISAGGKGYAGYGRESSTSDEYVNEFYEYNPTGDTWTKKSSFFEYDDYKIGMVCFAIADKVYIGLGRTRGDFDFATLFQYDPSTGWHEVNSLPGTERSNAVAFSIRSKGYVGLGLKFYAGGQVDKLKDFWQFVP